jgi:hypothetical protein
VSVTNTGTGNNVLSASPTLTGTIDAAAQTLSGNLTLNGGTANGVLYLNGSKAATSGSALVFDGTNLGIGTSSPITKLDVRSDAAVVATSGYAGWHFNALPAASTARAATIRKNYDSPFDFNIYASTGSSGNTAATIFYRDIANESMRLDSSGNLGIGTTSPATKLHIDTATAGYGLTLAASSLTARTYRFGLDSSANLALFDSNASAVRLTLDTSGNLGVGTSSPQQRLVVSNGGANGFEFDPTTGVAQTYNRSGAAYTSYKIYGLDLEFRAGASPAVAMTIDSNRNIVAGASAALATTATNGFLYVPTCAGTPTGTPTAITGMAPIVVNTTNNKLYFYSGGAWRDAGP